MSRTFVQRSSLLYVGCRVKMRPGISELLRGGKGLVFTLPNQAWKPERGPTRTPFLKRGHRESRLNPTWTLQCGSFLGLVWSKKVLHWRVQVHPKLYAMDFHVCFKDGRCLASRACGFEMEGLNFEGQALGVHAFWGVL